MGKRLRTVRAKIPTSGYCPCGGNGLLLPRKITSSPQNMQVLKDDIRTRIVDAAGRQFAAKGYARVSVRNIAAEAGVGVGNLYHYFEGKDGLFRAVVRPAVQALERLLQEHHGLRGEDVMALRSEAYLRSCVDEYVALMDTHRELLRTLLFRAQGSSLECFRQQYTDRSTRMVKAWFAAMQRRHPGINTAVSDFIIHLHTVWMFALFEELLCHDVPRQEMEGILHDYILFEIQGWRAIIRV